MLGQPTSQPPTATSLSCLTICSFNLSFHSFKPPNDCHISMIGSFHLFCVSNLHLKSVFLADRFKAQTRKKISFPANALSRKTWLELCCMSTSEHDPRRHLEQQTTQVALKRGCHRIIINITITNKSLYCYKKKLKEKWRIDGFLTKFQFHPKETEEL